VRLPLQTLNIAKYHDKFTPYSEAVAANVATKLPHCWKQLLHLKIQNPHDDYDEKPKTRLQRNERT
jgi:hypothetical protein